MSGGMPIAVHKVKVTFKDEPGEGSGVARSFYAAIADALMSQEKLPNLEACQVGSTSASPISSSASKMQQQLLNRLRSREREREFHRRRHQLGGSGTRRYPLSIDAPPFFGPGEPSGAGGTDRGGASSVGVNMVNWDPSKQALGERLHPRVRGIYPVSHN